MSDDIAARLRSTGGLDARLLCEAADEIERLRDLIGGHHYLAMGQRDEIKRLQWERDEARREILESLHPDLRKSYAAARCWDCFKEAKQ